MPTESIQPMSECKYCGRLVVAPTRYVECGECYRLAEEGAKAARLTAKQEADSKAWIAFMEALKK